MSLLIALSLSTASADTVVGSGYLCTTTHTAVTQGVLLTSEPDCSGENQTWIFGPTVADDARLEEGPVDVLGYVRAGVRTAISVMPSKS